VILHVPLGNYMPAVYTAGSDLRVEKFVYRLVRVQPDAQQRWTKYLSSLLAFSLVSPLVRYALLLLQVNAPEPWVIRE
jgi:potassium-transporting ATPase potassium-binding subunit